jgi:hypothetical protein
MLIGFGLLLVPDQTLKVLLSNGHYGDVLPRFAGMLMSGLGMSIAGIIRARAQTQYLATLAVRTYFIVCLLGLYWITADPLFLVILGVVLVGVALTLLSYLADRAKAAH